MMSYITGKLFFLISAMQNIPSELIITVKNNIDITSFKMKGSPDLGQTVKAFEVCTKNIAYNIKSVLLLFVRILLNLMIIKLF